MGRMVRKQVYIEQEHDELLKRRAAELGMTESELIRRGIEGIGRKAASAPLDEAAWQEELAFIEERARTLPATGPSSERRWAREEMYEERWTRRLSR